MPNDLLHKLAQTHRLRRDEYAALLAHHTPALAQEAARCAREQREAIYGRELYIRGLIEISNFCKSDCLYCGIRRSNRACERYRLTESEILDCCAAGYALGFRTFVLQSGEDAWFTDGRVCQIVSKIKNAHPDCAVTLSLGEKSRRSYQAFFDAGADRYLLRHETADPAHYARLHPQNQTFANRMRCLRDLKDIGYQVGCGFMVGSPYQTDEMLAGELAFLQDFQPDMCGIGPFIPHRATPFAHFPAGTAEKTAFLLSLIRLCCPRALLPATTALGAIHPQGRELGILAGANVVMPNLSPADARGKYELYDQKLHTGSEAAENVAALKKRMEAIGYTVVTARGDVKNEKARESYVNL